MPPDRRLIPFMATLAAVALLSLMDAVMKSAALAVGAFSALFLRSALNLAIVGPAWLLLRAGPATPAARRVHVRRGIVVAFMALTFFWGLARLPLAEALALSFTAPVIALFLAALLLGERIERRAILASLLGLGGVALIALSRANGYGGSAGADAGAHSEAGWGIAAVLVSSVLYAWNLVLQRQQALLAMPMEVAAWQNLMVAIVLLPAAPFLLDWPAGMEWAAIAIAGALSVSGALLFAWAYARAQAQALVPLEYSGFAWAALFGWLFFAESIRPPVLAGAGLIVLGCWFAVPRGMAMKRPEQTSA